MSVVALPDALVRAIAAEASRLPREALIHAAQSLSSSYRRTAGVLPLRLSDAERVAYAAMRLPATYAAVSVALSELDRVCAMSDFKRCLDVGAGPGTASLCAHALLPDAAFVQLERDAGWSALAQKLSDAVGLKASRSVTDAGAASADAHDLVIGAYVLNEVPEHKLDASVRALWAATSSALVIVEPGTPLGFGVVRRVREICLELGGHAAAPCTHNAPCPMTRDDWCHRAVRVERSALHRALKFAELGFEDEKFSYVAMTREAPLRAAPSRIVRKPMRGKGHLHLDLCSQDGLARTTIARSDGALYKAARDAEWGELWPPPQEG